MPPFAEPRCRSPGTRRTSGSPGCSWPRCRGRRSSPCRSAPPRARLPAGADGPEEDVDAAVPALDRLEAAAGHPDRGGVRRVDRARGDRDVARRRTPGRGPGSRPRPGRGGSDGGPRHRSLHPDRGRPAGCRRARSRRPGARRPRSAARRSAPRPAGRRRGRAPCDSTQTRSAYAAASDRSCSTTTTPAPAAAASRATASSDSWCRMSSAAVGSSSIRTGVAWASSRANDVRACSPPDRVG